MSGPAAWREAPGVPGLSGGWVGAHIELAKDGFVILLDRTGGQFHAVTSSLIQVIVENIDAACACARVGGGEILDPPGLRPRVRQAVVGTRAHCWALTEYVAETDPPTGTGASRDD